MHFKRVMGLLALPFGFLGVVTCMAAVYAVSLLGSRLERTNEKAFAMIDKGLASAHDRVHGVQKRLKESKITTTEIGQRLLDWGKRNAKERLVSRHEIESRVEKLAGHLQTAESWLGTSTESIQNVQGVLQLCNAISVPVDLASLEELLKNITSLRSRLQQTEQTVDGIRAFMANKAGESDEKRFSGITNFLGRILVTTDEIDTRLDESATRLSELQTDARQSKATTSAYILATTIGCYVLLAWIAAGQAALCLWGWTNCCPSRSSA